LQGKKTAKNVWLIQLFEIAFAMFAFQLEESSEFSEAGTSESRKWRRRDNKL
jgi:hypothetical protein